MSDRREISKRQEISERPETVFSQPPPTKKVRRLTPADFRLYRTERSRPALSSGDYSSVSSLAAAFLAFFASAASMALFRAARPAISPSVVFSTEALIFFTVDFVASAAARFSAFSAATSARLASSYVRRCERVIRLVAFENSITLKSSLSPAFGVVPSSLVS